MSGDFCNLSSQAGEMINKIYLDDFLLYFSLFYMRCNAYGDSSSSFPSFSSSFSLSLARVIESSLF